MKRYECVNPGIFCKTRCIIISEGTNPPQFCPYSQSSQKCHWVTDEERNPLQKLTAEALAERGIEWPEWAAYAVVSNVEYAYFYDKNGEVHQEIPGKWDAFDWPNSKIVRPEKKKEVPDWCKVWAWVFKFTQNKFHRIKAADSCDGHPEVTWDDRGDGYIGSCVIQHLRPARVRPWTKEEAPHRLKIMHGGEMHVAELGFNYVKEQWGYHISGPGLCTPFFLTLEDIAKNGVQLDSAPCGCLSVVNERARR